MYHPCFVVFDIVYLNGKSLAEVPLEERYNALCGNIKECPSHLEILPHEVKSTAKDIFECLSDHMMRCEEGIMIKDPRAHYSPGYDNTSWIKIKPEYIEALNDDVDVILVAGCNTV
jgi:DNA ligase 4